MQKENVSKKMMRKKDYIYKDFTCLFQEIHMGRGRTPFEPMLFEGQWCFTLRHCSIKMDSRLEQNPVHL